MTIGNGAMCWNNVPIVRERHLSRHRHQYLAHYPPSGSHSCTRSGHRCSRRRCREERQGDGFGQGYRPHTDPELTCDGCLVQLIRTRYPNMLDFEVACPYFFLRANNTYGRRSRWHVAANHPCTLSCPIQNATPWNTGSGQPRWPRGSRGRGESSYSWRMGSPTPR